MFREIKKTTGSCNAVADRILLVVDDELGIKKFNRQIGQQVRDSGHEIYTAGSAEEAVMKVLQLREEGRRAVAGFFNMRLLGEHGGIQTLLRIRAVDPLFLFVIVVTHGQDQLLELVGDLFQDAPDDWDFLRSPTSSGEILQKIRRVIAASNRRQDIYRLIRRYRRLEERFEHLTRELASTVAHRINNPIAFIQSNLSSLARHTQKIETYAAYVASGEEMFSRRQDEEARAFYRQMQQLRKELKLDFVLDDLGPLIKQSLNGTKRVKRIVQEMRK